MSPKPDFSEQAERIKAILLGVAIGGSYNDVRTIREYEDLRDSLMSVPAIRERLLTFVRSCGRLVEFWSYIQSKYSKYAERRNYIENEFIPLLSSLKKDLKEKIDMSQPMKKENRPRLFISHNSKDKNFVRRLVQDLESRKLNVWFDERELKPGDSIVGGISEGLKDTDYLAIVLSKASIKSRWVNAELNAALMDQLSGKGTVVLPIMIEDCEVPPLLRDRLYADFRSDYNKGLQNLLRVLEQESTATDPIITRFLQQQPADSCIEKLSKLSAAKLRRRMKARMGRNDVGTIWFDTFTEKMDDDMAGRTLDECIIELYDRARKRSVLPDFLTHLCAERPDLAKP